MERDTEKAWITFNPEEVERNELIEEILREIREETNQEATILDEDAGENVIVLLIPDCTLAQVVEIRGVLSGRSEGVL